MKPTTILVSVLALIAFACSSGKKEATTSNTPEAKSLVGYVDLTDPLDVSLVQEGTIIFTEKCGKCHTIDTVEFKVPALAGVTNRRSPEWIMNMIINIDEMLKQDPIAADLLRKHKEVMPDSELTVEQTRAVLEFLRSNDMEQVGEKDEAVGK